MNPIERLGYCLTVEHAPGAVGLAVLVCVIAFVVDHSLALLLKELPHRQQLWRWVRASALGLGVWATHFISMLGYTVAGEASHSVGHTLASLAIVIVSFGLADPFNPAANYSRQESMLRGAAAGAGTSIMHYVGMAGWQLPGQVSWEGVGLAISMGGGIGLFAAIGLLRTQTRLQHATPFIGAIAVAVIHYFGMSALTIIPARIPDDLPIAFSAQALRIPIAVALTGLLTASAITIALLIRRQRKREAERERVSVFANLAFEGLAICLDGQVINANESLATLAGRERSRLNGTPIASLFDPPGIIGRVLEDPVEVEAKLLVEGQTAIPVRLLARRFLMHDIEHVVFAVRDQRDRMRAEAELRAIADTDPLTGLVNRRGFTTRIGNLLDKQVQFALLIVDLDGFKAVNDTHGHSMGDIVLNLAADRIANVIGDRNRLARLGGDEFAALLPEDLLGAAEIIASQIVGAISQPFAIDEHVIDIGASVGLAYAPEHGTKPATLVRHADIAMYAAKDSGRSRWRRFDPTLHSVNPK